MIQAIGLKALGSLLGGLLLVGLLWLGVSFIKDSGRTEVELDTLKDQLELRESIDENIRNAPIDVDSAIELLRRRQNP